MKYFARMASPVGPLLLVGDGVALEEVRFEDRSGTERVDPTWRESTHALRAPLRQIDAYFAGRIRRFDLRFAPRGTPFQRRVWRELERIPYGATTSYAAVAASVGRPGACRAVGAANGRNPLAIVVPCHRVIGSSGKLTGYAGGLARKQKLLAWERSNAG